MLADIAVERWSMVLNATDKSSRAKAAMLPLLSANRMSDSRPATTRKTALNHRLTAFAQQHALYSGLA